MKTIPAQFTAKGFTHTEIMRAGQWRLFERQGKGGPHFEVVRIREHAAFEAHGKSFEAGESYPSSKTWGTDGFTLTTLESASVKLQDMAREASVCASRRVETAKTGKAAGNESKPHHGAHSASSTEDENQ